MADCVANSGYDGSMASFSANGCLYLIPGSCVFYTGANITGPGIISGEHINSVIGKIIAYVGDEAPEVAIYTGTAPISVNPSTHVISIPQASSSVSGYLSSTDWNTFNNKVSKTLSIIAQAPLTGGGTLEVNRTIGISQSTASTDGYLSSAHWVIFNNKVGDGVNLNPSGTVKANVFKQKNGSNILEFRQLIQGSNVTLTESSEGITISAVDPGGGGTVTAVTGTANRIISSGGSTPAIDIAPTYIGQTSITTLGTIIAGTWQGNSIVDAHIASSATWNAKQNGDPDLTQIAALTPSNGDFIERVGGVWTNRTTAQVKTDLGLAAIASSGSAADLVAGTIPTARIAGSATNGFVVKLVGGILTYQADLGSDTIRTVTSNTSVISSDRTILVDATSGNVTVTVDPAINTRMVNIKKIDTSTNVVTIQPSSGLIDGDASRNIEDPWTTLSYHSNGTNLYII